MILVYLWLPFILLALVFGAAVQTPAGRAHTEIHGFRQDRAWVLGLVIGILGPLGLLWWAIDRTGNALYGYLRVPPGIPFGAFKDGARTEADVEKLRADVRAGERPCFVRPFPCGCCGTLLVHAEHVTDSEADERTEGRPC